MAPLHTSQCSPPRTTQHHQAGTFAKPGVVVCADCPVGKHSPVEASEQCVECLLGQSAGTPGQSACTQCPKGKYRGEQEAFALVL